MKNNLDNLESMITEYLKLIIRLRNEIEELEINKGDMLKSFALGIIDILDSFEVIEEGIIRKGFNQDEKVIWVTKRFQSIEKKMGLLLQEYGISKIEFPDNRFILGFCEVVETQKDAERTNDEIIQILRNGYIRGKELIRPAQVILIKN